MTDKKPAENRLAHFPVADWHRRSLGYYGFASPDSHASPED